MRTHFTINGKSIDYDPSPSEARFLSRVEAAIRDAAMSELELRAFIYGPENPLLDQQTGYTFMTPAAFESPVFRVALDMLDRKRIATGALDLEAAAARYTVTVGEAAKQLGISVGAVRTAIASGRLPTWMKHGANFLSPESIASYSVSRRGPAPRLTAKIGSAEGASMRLRVIGGELEVTDKAGGVVSGDVNKWERVAVITGARRDSNDGEKATSYRYWLLEPGGSDDSIELGPFKVAGRFRVVEKLSGKAANEAWHALPKQAG